MTVACGFFQSNHITLHPSRLLNWCHCELYPPGLMMCSSLSFIVVSMFVISCTVLFLPFLSICDKRRLSGRALPELSCDGLPDETAFLA
jgi:hypothetical protein